MALVHGKNDVILTDVPFNKIVPMYDESTAFIIQNHGLRDFCKITLRRQGDELVVRNETLEEFTKQSKFLCWLDGYMLVKEEEGSKLSVIDERTKVKTYLPSPPSKSTHETFTMLYDGKEGKEEYKIIHDCRVERLRELKKENKDRREVKKVFDL
ncbi:hypothetical protein Tco_0695829 [Tanacetum coccineum]